VVQGDFDFRPTGCAVTPDGSLYLPLRLEAIKTLALQNDPARFDLLERR